MIGDFIPETRREALILLRAFGYDVDRLSPGEREAVRKLYNLDDTCTVRDALDAGRVRA
jgi:hypothetical protein